MDLLEGVEGASELGWEGGIVVVGHYTDLLTHSGNIGCLGSPVELPLGASGGCSVGSTVVPETDFVRICESEVGSGDVSWSWALSGNSHCSKTWPDIAREIGDVEEG